MGDTGTTRYEEFDTNELVILADGLEAIAFPEGSGSETALADQARDLGAEIMDELRGREEDTSAWSGYFEGA